MQSLFKTDLSIGVDSLPVQVECKVVDQFLRVETSGACAAVRGDRTVAGGHRAQRVVTTVDLRLKQKSYIL